MKKLKTFRLSRTVFLLYVLTGFTAFGQSFATLGLFNGSNGSAPGDVSLVQGFDGNFYGTTFSGGATNAGVIYNVSPSGTLTRLYSFCGGDNCATGDFAEGSLALAANGDFYGTNENGGNFQGGTIFRFASHGPATDFYNFCSLTNCDDGVAPNFGIIQADDGNFYGTASRGGVNGNATGTVFKIAPDGAFTLLYSFCSQPNCADGFGPQGLVQGTDGNFYGSTMFGGANRYGTAYRITRNGVFTVLHNFCGLASCAGTPSAAFIQGSDGNFYGTSSITIFKMTAAGAITKLADFCSHGSCPSGDLLSGGLIQGSDGNFYGTAQFGGANGRGTVFQMTPSGTVTTLYNFCPVAGCADGSGPIGGVVQGTDGNLYGTTSSGGINGLNCFECGTVYSVSLGLSPFVRTVPTSGKATQTINLLGQGFTGATSVTFNGLAASFTVDSDVHLAATVPAGATSGIVTVTTPGGPISTIVPFQVRP